MSLALRVGAEEPRLVAPPAGGGGVVRAADQQELLSLHHVTRPGFVRAEHRSRLAQQVDAVGAQGLVADLCVDGEMLFI